MEAPGYDQSGLVCAKELIRSGNIFIHHTFFRKLYAVLFFRMRRLSEIEKLFLLINRQDESSEGKTNE
jgi:hypothetical protein